MKGVILAAGSGEALRPITDEISKALVPILNQTLIEYAVERLHGNGIDDIIVVVGDNLPEVNALLGDGRDYDVSISYVKQENFGRGISDAVLTLDGQFRDNEAFVLTHCDIIARKELISRMLNAADNTGSDFALSVTLQSRTYDFGVVNLTPEGLVQNIIAEGSDRKGNYVVAGTFLLTPLIFSYLKNGRDFNDCFNAMIEDGYQVAAGIWNETWIDIGRPWDILRAQEYLLSKLSYSKIASTAVIGHNVELKGPVIIEENAKVLNGSVINGPVYIGKGAFIGNNSLIRDHSVIGAEAKVGMGVEIRSSLVMSRASIARLSYIGASIIGPLATIHSGVITMVTQSEPITTIVLGKEEPVPLEKYGAMVGPRASVLVHTTLRPGTVVDTDVTIEPHKLIGGRISK